MTDFVVDASVVASWLLPDEQATAGSPLFDAGLDGELVAPFHFQAEVANAVFRAHLRGRLDQHELQAIRSALGRLDIAIDLDGAGRVWADALPLALGFGIGLYDAIYLELALRLSLPLATFDEGLAAAAERAGVQVMR